MSARTDPADTTRPSLITAFAPAIGAAHYVVGDILMLAAEPDRERFSILETYGLEDAAGAMLPFSNTRLAAGAFLPTIGSLLIFPVAGRRRDHLREGGAPRWVGDTVFWSYNLFNTLSPLIHASFYQWAQLLKEAQRNADLPKTPGNKAATDEAVARSVAFNRKVETVYLVAAAGVVTGSVLEGVSIARGRSIFPRWSAALVTPLAPMILATLATAKGTGRHPAWRSLQGAGFSLGEVVAYAAGGLLTLRQRRRA